MNFPSLLLFDLGGVLIESSVFEELNRLLPERLERTAISNRWLFSPSARLFELGLISADEFAETFIAEWHIQLTPEAFLKEFASWHREFFFGARETIRDLRKTYRIGCLSNSNPLHCERLGNLEETFDFTLFSHLLGAIKPDPEIFIRALIECGVKPNEVYFFDDCSANVLTAQRLGITAFQVDGFASLQKTLCDQGLLSGSVDRSTIATNNAS